MEEEKQEQKNNQEQEIVENIMQDAEDTVYIVKDGANLAADIASQNYVGAVQDGIKLLNNRLVKKIILIVLLIVAVIIIAIAGFVYSIYDTIANSIESISQEIVDFFTVDYDGRIEVTDEQVDKIIESLNNINVDLADIHLLGDVDYSNPNIEEENRNAMRKYIRKFLEAQAMTQIINTKPNWVEENILNGGKPYGTVYVHRANGEENPKATTQNQLKYISYEDMQEMQGKGSSNNSNTSTSLDNFLFIGDSRVEGIETQLEALGKNITAIGIGSSRPSHWENVTQTGGPSTVNNKTVTLPSKENVKGISIALGVNGTNQTSQMKTVLNNLISRYPNVPIYVNSVFYVGKGYSYTGYTTINGAQLNSQIDSFNENIKAFCNTNSRLTYIDITEGLYESGYLKSAYSSDNVHLNSKGNSQLIQNIKAQITGGKTTSASTSTTQTKANFEDITKYFSINEKGELVIAGTTNTVVEKDGKIVSNQSTINLKTINYRNAISQYTTPMNFLLYLTMITQNPEFVSAVTDLVKQSEIRLMIFDTENYSENTEKYTYTENTKERKRVSNVTYPEWDTELLHPNVTYEYKNTPTSSKVKSEVTTTKTTTIIPTIQVTYVKTWFCEQTITYNKKKTDTSSPAYTIDSSNSDNPDLKDESEPQFAEQEEGTKTWRTGKSITSSSTGYNIKYEEGVRGDVIDKTGEKGSQGINKITNKVDKNSTFLGLLDDKFKIPNTARYDSVGRNLISGAEIFFHLLQKDAGLQNLEQIMRYILYKYTGRDYGVTEFDFSIFNAKEFTTVRSTSKMALLREYIREWEFGRDALTNADGTKYIIIDDGVGNPSVGYGIDIFNGGYASLFEQAGHPTYIGGEVDVEFVDALEEETIQSKLEYIRAITAELNLTEYQIHALVSRAYNCGDEGAIAYTRGSPSLNFINSYTKYWNQESDDQFEEQNSNANFSHSLYTQYMSRPNSSNGEYLLGLERRRRSEWTLFQTGYYDVLDKWYQEGGSILDMCEEVMNDLLDNNVKYSLTNLVWDDIKESSDFSKHGCCCATYVSVVLYRAGVLTEEHINKYSYNYSGTVEHGGVSTMLRDAGWIRVSEDEAEPGDVCSYDGHTFIYAGDNQIWDQNCGCISSSGSLPTRRTIIKLELL